MREFSVVRILEIECNDYHNTLELKTCHDANFVIIGGTGICHKDNLWCHQWRQSWHHDNFFRAHMRVAWSHI